MLSVFRTFTRFRPENIDFPKRTFFNKLRRPRDEGIFSVVELGNVSPIRIVPDNIKKPPYVNNPTFSSTTLGMPEIKSKEQISKLRDSCKLASEILKKCGDLVKVGVTTDDIDVFVHEETIKSNAYPSPLGYSGFPKSVCTSVNNVACHGIPDDRPLEDGDIINIDVTVFYNGFHGDCSKTFLVGNVDDHAKTLVEQTERILMDAIKQCSPGAMFMFIGRTIEKEAKAKGLTVVQPFIGHGIGEYFHGPPEILHYHNNIGGYMHPGMAFTIEPILSLGSGEVVLLEDGWTAVTVDDSRTAQFEHTILVTENGVDILTK